MHSNVLYQSLKLCAARGEVGLAIHFYQNAKFSARVNVLSDYAFGSDSRCFLLGRRQSLLTENDDGLFHVSFRLDEVILAIHHSGAGLFPEFFYMFREIGRASCRERD